MDRKRAYKYRCYPTDAQKHILAQTFGCRRYVYNWALRKRTDAYYEDGQRLYFKDVCAMLSELKKQDETAWLADVSAVTLQQSLRHRDKAFMNFFEGRGKYPTFKHKLAKAISDVGWAEFVSQLEYKAKWYGRNLVKIDRFYPSSKRCSNCGHILDSLPLEIRQWTCLECGVTHCRDVNAAKNVHAAGLAVFDACGEAIRPGRVKPNLASLSEAGNPISDDWSPPPSGTGRMSIALVIHYPV